MREKNVRKLEGMVDSEMAECNGMGEVKEDRKQRAAQLVINEHFVALPTFYPFLSCPGHLTAFL